jgi:hypothetical protein
LSQLFFIGEIAMYMYEMQCGPAFARNEKIRFSLEKFTKSAPKTGVFPYEKRAFP